MTLNNLIIRTMSGVVIAEMIVAAIILSKWTLLALSIVITAGSMYEFYKLCRRDTFPSSVFAILSGIIFVTVSFLSSYGIIAHNYMLFFFLPLTALYITELYRKKESPIENIAVSLLGFMYIAVPMALLNRMGGVSVDLEGTEYSYIYPLGFMILIWMNDVGAYMVGSSLGKNPLFPRISPKKSWEGFWGGFIITVAAGGTIGYLTYSNIYMWLSIAGITSLAGIGGDLVESMFKRSAGVKDSGNIIPGHGGFLDRFDAMFLSLPLVYIIIKFF
ncbi:MAG: phosphatidate cytidylyltransferase [Rikenellaceae bacterium]|nr:phosphatidate cytidylyltransferase [Rikenellaceae bacterium]